MKQITNHEEQLVNLKKIEGQIRGVQKMVMEGRYCVDILTQLHSAIGAILNVEERIFEKHLEGCVSGQFMKLSQAQRHKKIREVLKLVSAFRKV